LKRYTAHLKDFERDLSDIKRWTEKDTEKLAGKISGSFNRLNLIDTERQETASKLGFTADKISTEKPEKERRRDELISKDYDIKIEKFSIQKEDLKKKSDEIKQKLEKFKGSFYDWLNNEVSGWENSVGKVVSETVLFSNNLNPEKLSDNSQSIYGVKINLDEIDFADIVNVIGSEIQELINKEGEIKGIVNEINNDFSARNFVGAINSLQLQTIESENKIYRALVEIRKFKNDNQNNFGFENNLFSMSTESDKKNSEAVALLIQLSKEIAESKTDYITLSDSFELQFRIVELTRGSIIVCSKLWLYMAQTQVENRNFLKRLLF
jgi:hypothetical protein